MSKKRKYLFNTFSLSICYYFGYNHIMIFMIFFIVFYKTLLSFLKYSLSDDSKLIILLLFFIISFL